MHSPVFWCKCTTAGWSCVCTQEYTYPQTVCWCCIPPVRQLLVCRPASSCSVLAHTEHWNDSGATNKFWMHQTMSKSLHVRKILHVFGDIGENLRVLLSHLQCLVEGVVLKVFWMSRHLQQFSASLIEVEGTCLQLTLTFEPKIPTISLN